MTSPLAADQWQVVQAVISGSEGVYSERSLDSPLFLGPDAAVGHYLVVGGGVGPVQAGEHEECEGC